MEMLAYSKLNHSTEHPASGAERFQLAPLSHSRESQTVELIRHTLEQLQSQGAELGTTRRKLNFFYESYTRAGSIYLILIDSVTDKVVGGVGIVPFAGLDPSEGIGEIRELIVDPRFRRKGLGIKLMQAAFDTALALKYRRLYLEATAHMVPAEALFLSFGFRPVSLHQKTKKGRKDPLIRQAGSPAFFVWEDPAFGLRNELEPQHLSQER